jgi:hypothetical protein
LAESILRIAFIQERGGISSPLLGSSFSHCFITSLPLQGGRYTWSSRRDDAWLLLLLLLLSLLLLTNKKTKRQKSKDKRAKDKRTKDKRTNEKKGQNTETKGKQKGKREKKKKKEEISDVYSAGSTIEHVYYRRLEVQQL